MQDKEINISPKLLDKTSFEGIFKDYFKPLVAFGYKYVKDIDSSKEIVHDVFVNFWNKRDTIDLNRSVKSYLFNSVANRCKNWIRDHKKFQSNVSLDNIEHTSSQDAHDIMEYKELQEKIRTIIAKLPEKCRVIFEKNRFEGLKYQEIADELEISVKTVEGQMSKALKVLRSGLQNYIKILIIVFLTLS